MEALPIIPEVGSRVMFAEGTPQYPANVGIVYVVEVSPMGNTHSRDEHGRPYVWLVNEADVGTRPPSRRRRRTGWADALIVVDDVCAHEHTRQVSEHDVECMDCGMVGA